MRASEQTAPVFLPQILQRRAQAPGDTWSYIFLDSHGNEQCRWVAGDLAGRARAVAARLMRDTQPAEPVLLVFQPGPDFFAAFLGCLWSGRLATPINPPRRNRLIERLVAVATDSGARVALTSAGLAGSIGEWRQSSACLGALDWVPVDDLADAPDLAPAGILADDIAFLQYTSGSTALPKGVRVSHGNLVHDLARMQDVWALDAGSTLVSWLPAFHDLGLIFGLLQPLFSGCASVQMAPNAFLQKPALWLEAVTRYRGTHSAAPSFAYDLCCQRIAPADQAGLDLSSMVMTMNAAEPINPAVMEQFIARFGPVGFRRHAFAPAYGLAESTLAVTANPNGADPVVRHFDAEALAAGRVAVVAGSAPNARPMPGSGRALPDVPIAIVDPDTHCRCAPDRVGEIWVGGPTIAGGYWRRADETAATFGATIRGEAGQPYLRTGDLGAMVDGELFVTGRIKDLIILGGANFYPHDIERAAQNAHASLRRDNGAAFSIVADEHGDGREQVVLVQELERAHRHDNPEPIFHAVVEAVWQNLELPLARVVLVAPGTVLRTSSGKIQRLANRRAYLEGGMPIVAQWERRQARPAVEPAQTDAACADQRAGEPIGASALAVWLTGWLADRLKLPASAIGVDQGFAEMGLDSLGSTELAFALGRKLGVELPETLVFDHPTIDRLAAHLVGGTPPGSGPARGAGPNASPQGNDLEDLLAAIERGDA
jgi:acyl-CoA synthetase (AMP-forming)/AMP-acid ligase II/acyl carrier protein